MPHRIKSRLLSTSYVNSPNKKIGCSSCCSRFSLLFRMYLQRKIYIINCGHAIAGYYGQAIKGYEIVQDALQKFIAENGVEAAIVKYTGVAEGSRMYNVILEEYKKLA